MRVTWHHAALGPCVRGVGEQVVEGAAQHGQRPLDGASTCSTDRGVAGEVDEQAALAVRPLGERHRQRGAAVAHAGRDLLAAVEVAQRRVVDAGEHLRRHGADTPPTAMSRSDSLRDPAGDEGVGHDDGAPAALLGVGAHPGHRGAQHAGVGALGGAQGIGGQGRLEVGQGVHGDVAEEHRPADVGDRGAQVQAGPLEQARREPEPDGGVVVAAADHDLRAGVDEPRARLCESSSTVSGDGIARS